MRSRRELATLFPDIPRWVETRSMLLDGRAELFGVAGSPLRFAAADALSRLVSVVGEVDAPALRDAIQHASAAAVIAPTGAALDLPGWQLESAILYEQRHRPVPRPIEGAHARLIDPVEIPNCVPRELREELERASFVSAVAATFTGGIPVSFCYGVSTESLWDVSIDTLAEHRGRGYATLAIDLMTTLMAERGKRPVWGALESNIASQRLAEKLGFVPVDRIRVYSGPALGGHS